MKHRGKHPNDDKNFATKWKAVLTEASNDLSFLLGKGYAEKSALEIVGNRYRLNTRQRKALMRICCPSDKIESRKNKAIPVNQLKGKTLIVDGYNLLIIIEVALSGGYIFEGMDGCYRDVASIHGSYKKVEETLPALELIGRVTQELGIEHLHWYFDAPVSNSGRLKVLLYELAEQYGYNWKIDLVHNPDKELVRLNQISVTSDGWIIDESDQWTNLIRYIIDNYIQNVVKF
ncbi:MAG: DUF434 domain-containing protein [Saprospiraceae bacterium]|nr:DUF434 domain-containing protein [Saprospiraceae bacterium]